MAAEVLTSPTIWLGGYNITATRSALAIDDEIPLKPVPVFGDTGERLIAGIEAVRSQFEGWWDGGATAIDGIVAGYRATPLLPVTVAQQGAAAENDLVYFYQGQIKEYRRGAEFGEPNRASIAVDSDNGEPLVRGRLMHNATRTATGNGTARQLGAVGAAQKLYAVLHVLAASGSTPSLTVKVQSDDASGFSSPTDRITFGAASTVGYQWATPVVGAITDAWWRITWTISGSTPSFSFVVGVGIGIQS